ncbi:MAG: serine/threonine protein phosphatase [Enterovirga sp.]|jgi:serine/threonine protein phosphatase 1|nr:serine/threonine protein phosphatase [Enterovirga sp.]
MLTLASILGGRDSSDPHWLDRARMFRRVLAALRKASPGQQPEPPQLPGRMRVYAVGDIHGRADLLARMRDLIAADLARTAPDEALVVLLGDYIDRGPDSKGVLESLAREPFPVPTVALLGNHEAMLLEFLERPQAGEAWRRFGGIETVHSYGLEVADLRSANNLPAVAQALKAAIPDHHMAFLRGLQTSHRVGGYFFCHAGVRPGVPLEGQREEDLLWIRDEFIGSDASFGAMVVHGHTPSEQPTVRGNAIGIDTGAYITGRLTCLALGPTSMSFLST